MVFALAALAYPEAGIAAGPAEELGCIDNLLSDGERAEIAAMFPLAEDGDMAEAASPAISAASRNFAHALAICGDRYRWSEAKRGAATQYLMERARLSAIVVRQGEPWGLAMERYAPLAGAMLPANGEMDDHTAAMIAAGAKANGVVPADGEAVFGFLKARERVETSVRAFIAAR
jgi:hypothetical protein